MIGSLIHGERWGIGWKGKKWLERIEEVAGWDRSEGLGEKPEQLHANPLRLSPPGSETTVQIAIMKLD
jgi:hypothetical protein